jgi:hypothetical protein
MKLEQKIGGDQELESIAKCQKTLAAYRAQIEGEDSELTKGKMPFLIASSTTKVVSH